jgi:hypothetical protein
MDRITAIRKSLAAFVCGIIGVLPVLGLIAAVSAIRHGWDVRSQFRGQWNPASAYLRAGVALALFGLLSSLLLGSVIALAIADSLL